MDVIGLIVGLIEGRCNRRVSAEAIGVGTLQRVGVVNQWSCEATRGSDRARKAVASSKGGGAAATWRAS